MGTIYRRKNKLWVGYKGVDGRWCYEATKFGPDQRAQARKTLAAIERRIEAELGAGVAEHGPLTLQTYCERWVKERRTRGIASVDDEASRLRLHVYPMVGDVLLRELRPHNARDLVRHLRRKHSARGELLAPRTVLHCFYLLRQAFHDAVVDELIDTNPIVVRKEELPEKQDKDRAWRRTAVFSRDEVEAVLSAPTSAIPEDRRTLYAIMFLGAMRFGEAAALTWRDYDAACVPLGKLVVDKSYNTKTRKVKGTKTENPREMPVHATLARILAEWKLGGFHRLAGRVPRPEDPIVPSRRGAYRNVNHGLRRFHEDLERLGLRSRRQHDTRRTFISLAIGDGARKDVLRWVTHGPTGDVMDLYTSIAWSALCEEVAKLKVSLRTGEVIALRPASSSDAA